MSVLTPSFEYGRFISEAAESVLRQPGIVVQHVVQDAGSGDETIPVLKSLAERHADDVSWVSQPDEGQSDALNGALHRASGRWIGWLNADEFYMPDGLWPLVQEGDRTGADVVFADCIFIDGDARFLRLKAQHPFSHYVLKNYGTFIATCSMIVRRSALWEDPWDVRLRLLMDRDLFMQLHRRGAKFRYVRWPAAAFRVHEERVSAGTTSSFASDYAIVHDEYGGPKPGAKLAARSLHVLLKAASGGHLRELKGRRFAGSSMSWSTDPQGRRNFDELLRLCYDHVEPTTDVKSPRSDRA